MASALFPPSFFQALAGLSRRRRREAGGEGSAPRAGRGQLGFEHRAYRPGDDLRQLDWRATARSGLPQLRLREQDRGGELRLVLDRSASLGPGHPHRDHDQRRLALALGWLQLEAGGIVRLRAGDGPELLCAGFERRGQLQGWLEELGPLQAGGGSGRRGLLAPGRCLWLTDPWSELPAACSGDATVVTLILPEEDDPPAGGLRLLAVESGEELEVELEPSAWAPRWESWLQGRSAALRAAGAEAVELRCGITEEPSSILARAQEAGLV